MLNVHRNPEAYEGRGEGRGRGYGGGGEGYYIPIAVTSVTTRTDLCIGWVAMRAILMFHNNFIVRDKVTRLAVSTDHKFQWLRERRAEGDIAGTDRGPSAYQPADALPLGQTGSPFWYYISYWFYVRSVTTLRHLFHNTRTPISRPVRSRRSDGDDSSCPQGPSQSQIAR